MAKPLRLPEGYSLEMRRGDRDYLLLARPDGTTVVAFEFSAVGPDPGQIMQVAQEDAEWREQASQDEGDPENDS